MKIQFPAKTTRPQNFPQSPPLTKPDDALPRPPSTYCTEMDSATSVKTSNPKNVYHIGGIQVEFPFQPYGSQLAFMGRVIATLDRAQRDGHCHALLESPTGTGKSLSLLCSSLAWQQNYRSKNLYANLSHSKPAPEALSNPLAYGGGFVPETQPSTSGNAGQAPSGENSKNKKKKAAPTIFYASRTHSQISQVICEYRKTSYRVPMAILASRKNYCTSPYVRGKENIDEECKLLLKNKDVSCPEFKNMHKVKGHPSVQRGGCHEVHDIEDLVKVGQVVKGCSYFAARSMADDAQLVFCPYSYIINPVIRGAMEVDIKGAILILDEAHNIEDMARDAGSVDLEEDVLEKLQIELQQLCLADALIYQPLYEMTQDITSWIQRRKDTLEKREFQTYCSCWTGDKALRELQEANITIQCFPILLECARKAIKVATDAESDVAHLSGMAVLTLEGLISSLSYFFSRNGLHVLDYQLALRRYVKRDAAGGGWTHTFSLWCLNPGVVFREIADLSLSVILTSGTLSPMNSFSSELGVQFGTCLEAPHVIDADSQLWAAVISTGLNNYPLNASYKTADHFDFQDALGKTLEEICKIVPGGALVFFPSYKLMDKLCYRWKETGQWSQLNARKSLFVEPRGGHQDDFDSLLKGYYNTIHRGSKSTIGRKRRGKKIDPNHLNAMDLQESFKKEGAAFLAVCRGKVSEGIDFSDESARVVIVVGIPFPNINDIQIAQKKKYNDTYKTSKNLLSGNEWYCHQAFRALNQAAGRCIRHRFDYGAIILLDERFQEERNTAYVSKWLRKSIRKYENFSMALEGLKSFYTDAKEKFGNKPATALEDSSDLKVGNIYLTDQTKGFTTKKNQPNPWGQKPLSNTGRTSRLSKPLTSMTNYYSSVSKKLGSPVKVEIQSSELTSEKDISGCRESTNLECSPHKDLRCSRDISIVDDCAEVSIVKETPADINLASPVSFCKDENSSSTIIQTSLNLSVNSHTQKRRKSMCSPLVNLVQAEHPDALDLKTPGNINYTENLNRRIEFDMETNCSELPAGPVLDKKLKLLCLKCRNPLGLPENELYVTCSLTSSTKVHLASLLKGRWEPLLANTLTSIPVVISDILSVNPKLCMKAAVEDARGEGVWCEKDGCVFNTIFCPFCTEPKNCLGVQIMATDASNVQLLNKILFYFDRLEIKNAEVAKESVISPQVGSHSSHNVKAVLNPFDKFACKSPLSSGGWRTTRSKMRLPKRALISDSDDQCGTQTRPHVMDI